jgi:hypothetical protein
MYIVKFKNILKIKNKNKSKLKESELIAFKKTAARDV